MEPQPPAARESVLTEYRPPAPDRDRVGLHVGLFLATFACMVWVAGFGAWEEVNGELVFFSFLGREAYYQAAGWTARLADGLLYAAPFLLFLTVHEFGHYLAARWHGVRVSLPYYIPLPIALGTFGAVIRIREPIRRTRQLFDIGAAGPLAGFVVALGLLGVAVATLPPVEYLLSVDGPGMTVHGLTVEQYRQTGAFPPAEMMPRGTMQYGTTPLFAAAMALADYPVPSYEIMHYPMLMAGWLGLFFTALNLLPVGQLDGGHVVYSLFGPAVHRVVARVATLVLLVSGCVGWIGQLVPDMALFYGARGETGAWAALGLLLLVYLRRFFGGDLRATLVGVPVLLALAFAVVALAPGLALATGYWGWMIWVGLILFVIGVDHPPVLVQEPLTPARTALGWACIVIFLLCFSIQPITMG